VFFILSKLLDVFLSPLGWALVLLAFAIPWRRPRRRSRWKRQRVFGALSLLVLWIFSLEPVSNTLFHHLEHQVESTNVPTQVYDAVVLLGGAADERAEAETGQLSFNDNVERVIATHRVLSEGHARFAILSGAASEAAMADHSEARMLARQLVQWGIPPGRLILEERARNTHENAVYSKEIAIQRGFAKVLIITSAFHMARAVECFGAVGVPVDTLIVDYRAHRHADGFPKSLLPRASALDESSAYFREVFGLWIYRWQGYAKTPIKTH
jgi:uncharacterized SAM-binding protein YcdF (DUF218 family)